MRTMVSILMLLVSTLLAAPAARAETPHAAPKRIFIVSSYHREYLWSQSTQAGVSQAMLDLGYLDNRDQAATLVQTDEVTSSTVMVKKAWMDTKRNSDRLAIAEATYRIAKEIKAFAPDLLLLGDDNATKYIGNRFLDMALPIVFWGVNGLPIKYGLVDSMDNPGHNVTGVWQSGSHKESLEYLKRLVPSLRTFAVLACDSETARANLKQIQMLSTAGELPLALRDVVLTGSYEEFQKRALELQDTVDAFFVLNHDTLTDKAGNHVDMMVVGRWYLTNIRKPEVSHEDQFVKEGMLLTANDSGYNQGYRAIEMAYDILNQGYNPAHMRTVAPPRGPVLVNAERAAMLGLDISQADFIDEVIADALALKN